MLHRSDELRTSRNWRAWRWGAKSKIGLGYPARIV